MKTRTALLGLAYLCGLSACGGMRAEEAVWLVLSPQYSTSSETDVASRHRAAEPASTKTGTPVPAEPFSSFLINPEVSRSVSGGMGRTFWDGSLSLLTPLNEGDVVGYGGAGVGLRRLDNGSVTQNNAYVGLKGGVRFDGVGRLRPAVELRYGLGKEWNFTSLVAMLQVDPRDFLGGN